LIREAQPDVVFLDVQMPELDGFEVLARIDAARLPVVVFVTAFDEFAVRAFEVRALDYLLKPFDRARLGETLERVRALLAGGSRLPADRLVIRDGGRVHLVSWSDIDWIESAGNYVRVHAGTRSYFLRDTITHMTSRVPPVFLRISRSAIINLRHVREAQPLSNGCYVFVLRNGARVESSRRFRRAIADALDAR
jgi:two-component system LytT family response regulator